MNGTQGTQAVPQGMAQAAQGAQGFQGGPPNGFAGGPGGRGMLFGGPFLGIGTTVLLVVTLVVLAIAFWQFLRKAGFTPALGLLMLVPLVNLGVALWLAFTEWPLTRELERTKLVAASLGATGTQSSSPTPRSEGADLPAASQGVPEAPGA